MLSKTNARACLHVEIKSLLVFNEAHIGLYTIKYFSHRHMWQRGGVFTARLGMF